MYFRLDADPVVQNVCVTRVSHPFTTLMEGSLLPVDTPVPFEFSMEVDLDQDGEVEPAKMFAFNSEPCLMQRRFLEVLREAGVDNIQDFPAILTNAETGETHSDYVAANVIGLVNCADLSASKTSPLADVYYFHSLVIDPAQTGGLLLFRLAESQMEIIVHETVARAIEAGGFQGIVLEPLATASSAR